MNSQEIIFKFENGEKEALKKIKENYAPLVQIKDNEREFSVFSHPILGIFFVCNDGELTLRKTFFSGLSQEEYFELGKLAKHFSNVKAQYKILLSKNNQEKTIFSYLAREKFYSD
ncbi:MAG: hypothetical protein PHU51_01275 [Candidatus Nanoarchaeia archaeon]|nr:hypothetical protein [Candidatus Nanoarchaeia archaeon]